VFVSFAIFSIEMVEVEEQAVCLHHILLQTWQECSKHSQNALTSIWGCMLWVRCKPATCFNKYKMAKCQLTMMNVLVQLQLAQQQNMLQKCMTVSARSAGGQSTTFATLQHCPMGHARAFCQTNST